MNLLKIKIPLYIINLSTAILLLAHFISSWNDGRVFCVAYDKLGEGILEIILLFMVVVGNVLVLGWSIDEV